MAFDLICIGTSSGGFRALRTILSSLDPSFETPIVIVQHIGPRSDSTWIETLNEISPLKVQEAEDKEPILPGHVYIAPPNYHLLVEQDKTLSLLVDEKVNFARPSIDVLFESVADTCGTKAIGIVLTGANSDGAKGLREIWERGGIGVVQNPQTAETPAMPLAAIKESSTDHICDLEEIPKLLSSLALKNTQP